MNKSVFFVSLLSLYAISLQAGKEDSTSTTIQENPSFALKCAKKIWGLFNNAIKADKLKQENKKLKTEVRDLQANNGTRIIKSDLTPVINLTEQRLL